MAIDLKKELLKVEDTTPTITVEVLTSDLNEDQKVVFTDILNFLNNPDKQVMHLLEGYAGTGKTYTLSRILGYVIANTSQRIAMTATTNKAVKVLKRAAMLADSDRISFSTIHSLLGLKENIKADGTIDFVADKMKPREIDNYQICVIDESSMLDDKLFLEISYCLQSGLKVLFVGDGEQIPPVNGTRTHSIPFDETMRNQYKIGRSVLSKIVRQKEGSPIIEATLAIRNNSNSDTRLIDLINYDWDKERGGVMMLDIDSDNCSTTLEKLLTKLYKSDHFDKDADYAKVIAWRNATVNGMNTEIRKILYGPSAPAYVIGEKLLANTPITKEVLNDRGTPVTSILFHTNDEFIISDITRMSRDVRGETIEYYQFSVDHESYTGEVTTTKIEVLHEDSATKFKAVLDLIKQRAVNLKHIPDQAKAAWKEFYTCQRIFADIKYNYCITAHKSQGSTYQNCIVMDWDINLNRNVSERNRIKYTACSRAAKTLVVVS